MQEIWKDIEGYEGLYQVSNLGRVKSLKRKTNNQFGKEERILSLTINSVGYKVTKLSKSKMSKTINVHRLVAETFIPNPNNYPCINHKDGDKTNNCIDNLEWCTYSHNNKEAFKLGLRKPAWKGKKGSQHNCAKKVKQYDLNGNLINEFGSITEAGELFSSISKRPNDNISEMLRGKSKESFGYIWKYAEK